LDSSFNAILALLFAGLVGPRNDHLAELAEVARLATAHRERQILRTLAEAARSTTGDAVILAALFEAEDPEVLLFQAVARFRSISWDVLARMPEIIVAAGSLDGQQASTDLYSLSEPCRVGECDAFVSHSWHDDAFQKWEALQGWCSDAEVSAERSPRLWLDKVCIDQTDIKADLQCLPIFLAGSNLLLVVSGSTFIYRLWNCVELFVYVTMLQEEEMRKPPIVLTIGSDEEEHECIRKSWRDFDASTCRCFNEEDKERIFAVIACCPGGVQGFNDHMKVLAVRLFWSARASVTSRMSVAGSFMAMTCSTAPRTSTLGQLQNVPWPEVIGGRVEGAITDEADADDTDAVSFRAL
jgi:hypothetical protein